MTLALTPFSGIELSSSTKSTFICEQTENAPDCSQGCSPLDGVSFWCSHFGKLVWGSIGGYEAGKSQSIAGGVSGLWGRGQGHFLLHVLSLLPSTPDFSRMGSLVRNLLLPKAIPEYEGQ